MAIQIWPMSDHLKLGGKLNLENAINA